MEEDLGRPIPIGTKMAISAPFDHWQTLVSYMHKTSSIKKTFCSTCTYVRTYYDYYHYNIEYLK